MAEEYGRLEKDPLFLALTRPTMVLGVTYMWLAVEALVFAIYFINTSNFIGIFTGLPVVHLIGVLITAKDPKFMDVFMAWSKTFPKCRNRIYHGNTSSYDLF